MVRKDAMVAKRARPQDQNRPPRQPPQNPAPQFQYPLVNSVNQPQSYTGPSYFPVPQYVVQHQTYPATAYHQDSSIVGSGPNNSSWTPSDSPSSTFDFGSPASFSNQQDLSSGPLTPSSSEESHLEFEQNATINLDRDYFHAVDSGNEPFAWINAPNPFNHALQGLENHYSEHNAIPFAPIEPLSPFGRSRAQHAPSLAHNEPWSTLQPREHQTALNCPANTAAGDEMPTINNGNGVNGFKKGVRSRPLTEEQKLKTNATRQKGACLRCRLFKEPCDQQTVCARCTRTHRKWSLGCVRDLSDRWRRLQPEPLVAHLRRESFSNFVSLNCVDSSPKKPFPLRLALELGLPFQIRVREVEPFGERLLQHDGFRPWSMTVEDMQYECIDLSSPPLLPDFDFDDPESGKLRNEILRWVEDMLCDNDGSLTKLFPNYCFESPWEAEMLRAICQYYDGGLEEHAPLKDALTLALLNYLMTKSLVVPNEEVPAVSRYIQNPKYRQLSTGARCSPAVVNRFVKVLLLETVEEYTRKTLGRLQSILLDKSRVGDQGHAKDLFLALSFILLMVLSRNQIALISRALMYEKRGNEGLPMKDAINLVRKMETEFTDHIIGLCQYFNSPSQKKPKSPAGTGRPQIPPAGGWLWDRQLKITKTFCESIRTKDEWESFCVPTGLEEIDKSSFGATNKKRVLYKFFSSIWADQQWTPWFSSR